MSLHKLTAGDGYTYLTRQVAVQDATDRGTSGLADYYAEKGESPGHWWGSGLAGVGLIRGATVTEAQMKSLFGEGRHPDAESIRMQLVAQGAETATAERNTRIGQPFRIASGATEFAQRVAAAYVEHNRALGVVWSDPIDAPTRASIRTRIADDMFVERYGRRPADDRERHGFVAQESRQRTSSVAGFDLTFTPVKSVSALWALADPKIASEIEAAHAAAVQDTLAWLEDNVLFTRRGHRGVRQVRTCGLIATAFTHRDSRAGDPNLHTHVAISNKVPSCSTPSTPVPRPHGAQQRPIRPAHAVADSDRRGHQTADHGPREKSHRGTPGASRPLAVAATAINAVETQAVSDHESRACENSEWSWSHCEAETLADESSPALAGAQRGR